MPLYGSKKKRRQQVTSSQRLHINALPASLGKAGKATSKIGHWTSDIALSLVYIGQSTAYLVWTNPLKTSIVLLTSIKTVKTRARTNEKAPLRRDFLMNKLPHVGFTSM